MKKKLSLTVGLLLLTFISTSVYAEFMDRVLVVVNEDVITQSEFDFRLQRVKADVARDPNLPALPPDVSKQLMNSMVLDRIQLQEAERRGITVTEQEVDLTLERLAEQQNLTVQQLLNSRLQNGESVARFRNNVKSSIILSRLTEFYTRSRVVVPEYEIDGFIDINGLEETGTEYQIERILIKDPDTNQALAEQVLKELDEGLSFQQAVKQYSQATDVEEGGGMGWRTADQLPEMFVEAIKDTKVGGVTEVLKTPGGLHILKLVDLKGDRTEIIQNNVRHILISAESTVAKSQASKRLIDIRERIKNGESFADLARIYSDDSVSAANGGSLGWVSPGQMVKPFEDSFQKLNLGEISEPVATEYGVHIMQVEDRREKNITDPVMRNRADNFLRRQRAGREYDQWVKQLRAQAYVNFVVDDPLSTETESGQEEESFNPSQILGTPRGGRPRGGRPRRPNRSNDG